MKPEKISRDDDFIVLAVHSIWTKRVWYVEHLQRTVELMHSAQLTSSLGCTLKGSYDSDNSVQESPFSIS
jgi:hypothetical protein